MNEIETTKNILRDETCETCVYCVKRRHVNICSNQYLGVTINEPLHTQTCVSYRREKLFWQ